MNPYDKEHLKRLAKYERQITAIYYEAVKQAALIGSNVLNFSPNKPFYFADYPGVKAKIEVLLNELNNNIYSIVVNGIEAEWTLSNNKNSALAQLVFGEDINKLSSSTQRKYFSNNIPARDAFLKRKREGLSLSKKIWKHTEQFKQEIELGLDLGIRNGLSSDKMNAELRSFLKAPEKLFRRVRDEHGNLRLSKAAKAYNPGRGVYRSSYKNTRRLTATETNMSYRTADHERWQQFDFVVGIEIKLSNNHTLNGEPLTDICDTLAGTYPKDFKFTGFHPFCRCITIPILMELDELDNLDNGFGRRSKNQVDDMPKQFNSWIADNKKRVKAAKTLPYFLSDNKKKLQALL